MPLFLEEATHGKKGIRDAILIGLVDRVCARALGT
jgi:hypothetical protein